VLEVDSDASGPDEPGAGGISTAHFSHYEILVWYRGPVAELDRPAGGNLINESLRF
jgi:hypothetical protein